MYLKYNFAVLFFFGIIILLPFIGIFSKVNYELNSIYDFIQNSYTHRLIYFSIYQAFFSAILSCFLAIPFALSLNRHKDLKIIKFIISLCGFCFVIPTILIVFAVIILWYFLQNYYKWSTDTRKICKLLEIKRLSYFHKSKIRAKI